MSIQALTLGLLGPIYVNEVGTRQALGAGAFLNTVGQVIYSADVEESASALDTVSAEVILAAAVAESESAVDSVSAATVGEVGVEESASAADTVSAQFTLAPSVVEATSAVEIVSAGATITTSVTETSPASDTLSTEQTRRVWFLSFANVTPPPQFQGPGNPGKLKGDYRDEEIP